MGSYGIWMALSSLISAIMGGGAIYLFTLKAQKKKAAAEANQVEANAEGTELSNVEKAITIWRKMAEDLAKELDLQRQRSDELKIQIDNLSKQVAKLTCINSKILHLLDKITPENLAETVGEMKKLIEK